MSPPLTEASKIYGFFCSNPAARGDTATIAKISLIFFFTAVISVVWTFNCLSIKNKGASIVGQ